MPKLRRNGGTLWFAITCTAACLQGAPGGITLNDKEYFEAPGFVFLVDHNVYAGPRGGLQMMQNGEWLLGSDDPLLIGSGSPGRTAS